jgi:predicted RNase H-like HicB family nuclease
MELNTYHVHAEWDPEAAVWVAASDDLPGLMAEAQTIESLTIKLRTMIPELLKANRMLPDGSIVFELTSHRQEFVTFGATNKGLVDWLLACPEKDFFVPVESDSTDAV